MLHILFCFLNLAWAADQATNAIEQAHALALKKNRQEACAVLQRTIESTPTGNKGRTKLLETLDSISKMFFTDKGQKAFESAQAIMWDTPDIALGQFRSSLALEDENVQILNGIARIQIAKQDCDAAMASIQASRKINTWAADAALLELRALACQGNYVGVREKAKVLPPMMGKWNEAFVQYLLAQDQAEQKAWRKSLDLLQKVSDDEPQFPEAYFYMSKAGSELSKDVEPWLQKYVTLCKGATAREKKRYALEPRLCANVKEAESELAAKKTEI